METMVLEMISWSESFERFNDITAKENSSETNDEESVLFNEKKDSASYYL